MADRGYNTIYECKRCWGFVSDEPRGPFESRCNCGHLQVTSDKDGKIVIRLYDEPKVMQPGNPLFTGL